MRKLFLLLCITSLCACIKKQPQVERPLSVQTYSIPEFTDSSRFGNLEKYFPVVDSIYTKYARDRKFPSIAYGVVVGDHLVYANATGLANIKDKRAATTRSLYRIASMSKSFTAMSILKLRDEGKLNLSDPVSKYIPDFAGSGAITTDAPDVTILHLLTMSAGFPEDNPWGDRQLSDTDQDLLDQVKNGISFSNAPGLHFEYSNLGYALLGKIIANVSGISYQQYITQNIMKPLGMTDSKWEYTDIPAEAFAPGYRWEDDAWKEEPVLHDGSYGAMGGLICSIEDFSKYISLHLSAWPPRNSEDKGPLKRSSVREMHQPWRVRGVFGNARTRTGEICAVAAGYGYGLGWRQDCNGTVRISHSGGLPGYGSEWRIYPEYNMGVVSFSNFTYGAPGLPNAIVLDTLIQLAGLQKRELPPSKILLQRKDEIVALISDWTNAESKGIFAENFWLDSDVTHRSADARAVLDAAGKILRVSNLKPENQLRGTFLIECEKGNVRVFFTLTPEPVARIQQLDIELE